MFDVGGTVVLGQAKLFLDNLELFLEKEFALVITDGLVDLLADLALQASDIYFLFQQHQYLFHSSQYWQGIHYLLQLTPTAGGQCGGKVSQRGGLIGAEAVEIVLQFLAVQGVQRQQFLDRVYQGDGIGTHLVTVRRLGRGVFDLGQIGRLATDPADNTHPGQALGNELQFAAFLAGMMHLDHATGQRQVIQIKLALAGIGLLDIEK